MKSDKENDEVMIASKSSGIDIQKALSPAPEPPPRKPLGATYIRATTNMPATPARAILPASRAEPALSGTLDAVEPGPPLEVVVATVTGREV